MFLYSDLNKSELIEKIREKIENNDQIMVREVDVNSEDISNIRNWIGKVMIPKPKETKNPVEVMMNFVDEVEKELERQLKGSDGVE